MQILKLTALLFLLYGFISLYAGDNGVNFSGTWGFNESKSTLGEGPGRRADAKLVIKQTVDSMYVERSGTRRSGDTYTYMEKLTLDGKSCSNTFMADREKTSLLQWSADKKSLLINSTMIFQREGNTMEIKVNENWSLSADGKVLTIDYTSTSDFGERKAVYCYDQQ